MDSDRRDADNTRIKWSISFAITLHVSILIQLQRPRMKYMSRDLFKRKMLDKTECTVRYRRVNCQSVRTILTHHLLLQSVNCLWDWLREYSSQLTLRARPTSADRISLLQTLSIYNTGPSLLALSDVGTQDPISTLSHVSVARMPKGTFAHVTST